MPPLPKPAGSNRCSVMPGAGGRSAKACASAMTADVPVLPPPMMAISLSLAGILCLRLREVLGLDQRDDALEILRVGVVEGIQAAAVDVEHQLGLAVRY